MSNYVALTAVVLGLVTSILGLLNARQGRRAAVTAQEISVKVDGNLDKAIARIAQLTAVAHDAGVTVPPPAGPEKEP